MFTRDKNEEEVLKKKLGKIVQLPNEDPTILVISDAEGLQKHSSFYGNVRNGDKILIYIKTKQIIIYREDENQVVNIGSIEHYLQTRPDCNKIS